MNLMEIAKEYGEKTYDSKKPTVKEKQDSLFLVFKKQGRICKSCR